MNHCAEQDYLFRHAILQEVAYSLQPPSERSELHANALEVLEQLFEGALEECAIELAQHALRARADLAIDSRTRSFGRKEVRYLKLAASVALRRFDLGRAMELLQTLADCPFSDRATRVQALRECGEAALDISRYAQAAFALHKGLSEARKHGMRGEEARLLLHLSRLAYLTGKVPEALTYSDQARAIAESLREPELEFAVMHELGALLFQRGQARASQLYFDRAVALARGLASDTLLASALNRAGASRIMSEQTQEGDSMLTEAYEIATRIGDQKLLGAILGNRGVVLRRQNWLAEAIDSYRHAEKHNRQLGMMQNVATNLDNMGVALGLMERFDEASESHEMGLRTARELGLPAAEGFGLLNLALIRKRQGRIDETLSLLTQSERLLRKSGAMRGVANALINRADANHMLNRPWAMLRDLVEAGRVNQDIGDPAGYWDAEERTFRPLMQLGVYAEVYERAKLLHQANATEDLPDRLEFESLYWMAVTADRLGNHADALRHALAAQQCQPKPGGWPGPSKGDAADLAELVARLQGS